MSILGFDTQTVDFCLHNLSPQFLLCTVNISNIVWGTMKYSTNIPVYWSSLSGGSQKQLDSRQKGSKLVKQIIYPNHSINFSSPGRWTARVDINERNENGSLYKAENINTENKMGSIPPQSSP